MKSAKNSLAVIMLLILSAVFAQAQEAGGVKGKIRTTKGDAIAGVNVVARQDGADVKSVKSGADGKFVLDGLKPGVYNIVFDKSGYALALKNNVEIRKNKTDDLGDRLILLVAEGSQVVIKGSVFNQDGRSVGGARVEIERILSDGSTKKVGSGYTNISGEFTFRFPEGVEKYRITASLKDASASKDLTVTSAEIYRLAISLNIAKN